MLCEGPKVRPRYAIHLIKPRPGALGACLLHYAMSENGLPNT